MSDKKFKPVDFSKGARKVFEFVLMLLKIVGVAAIVLVVAAFTVVPAIASGDPSKLIGPAMKAKDLILKRD